jgi:Asp-tRNA(Asn)/Glu-tRNA(Gln) amidotransferase A subunit family amidase
MSIDSSTVKKVASLARIAVTDDEAERLVPELNNILGWVEQLGEVDVSGVQPMTAKPLSGLPIGMKDLFCTEGVQTTAASHILEGFRAVYESTVSAKLWAAGAGMLGKLNLDQFAMGSPTRPARSAM